MFQHLRNTKGMSLIELLAASGLVAMIVGLSVTPILQMKKLEKKAEFQSSLNTSHQLAVLKARNGKYLKDKLGLTPPAPATPLSPPSPPTAMERCFGGRGAGCASMQVIDTAAFAQPAGYAKDERVQAESRITIDVTCPTTTKCTLVEVSVATQRKSGSKKLDWRNGEAILANFELPAIALASRQEIDFSACTGPGKVITGVDYETLKANCDVITGNTTCVSLPNSGPITTIGQTNGNVPANCQAPPAITCPNGMKVVGLGTDQPVCADAIVCTDAFSTNCTPPVVVCNPNWVPVPNSVCAGKSFTQTDSNNCPGSATRSAVGTNAALCVVNSCTMSGPVRWPNPVTGPCGVSNAAATAGPGSSSSFANENLGFYGTYTVSCVDKSPQPSAYNTAAASSTCAPVSCSGLPGTVQWSNSGIKSGVPGSGVDTAGPWACSGAQNITQNSAQPAGVLLSTQADGSARSVINNTAAGPTGGSVTLTCNDPGPATSPRAGVLTASGVNCAVKPAGYCLYSCIENFSDGANGRIEVGETSTDQCMHRTNALSKFHMGCIGYNGASCKLTTPEGPNTRAFCSDGSTPIPTPPPSVRNVCTFTSDTASIGDGEMVAGQSWTFASQASKGGFSCDTDPAANVKCEFSDPLYNYWYGSCSEITLGYAPPTGTGTCELQTIRCVAK